MQEENKWLGNDMLSQWMQSSGIPEAETFGRKGKFSAFGLRFRPPKLKAEYGRNSRKALDFFFSFSLVGKQNWRCGMNRTLSLSAKVCAQISNKCRNRLLPNNAEQLLFVHENIANVNYQW